MQHSNLMWPLIRNAIGALFTWAIGGFVLGIIWDIFSGFGHAGIIFVWLGFIHGMWSGLAIGLWMLYRKKPPSLFESMMGGMVVTFFVLLYFFGYGRSVDLSTDSMILAACPITNSMVMAFFITYLLGLDDVKDGKVDSV